MLLSLVIPGCDDARFAARLEDGIQQLAQLLPYPFEVIAVREPGRQMPPALEFMQSVVSETSGHGAMVKAGMLAANGLFRMLIDPRWLVEAEQLLMLLPPVHTGFDVCLASRHMNGSHCSKRSSLGQFRKQGIHQLTHAALKPGISDPMAPVQVYRADAARALFSRSMEEGHAISLEVLALADRMGLRIQEQPIDYADSPARPSWLIHQGIDALLALGRIRIRLQSGVYPILEKPPPPPNHWRLRP